MRRWSQLSVERTPGYSTKKRIKQLIAALSFSLSSAQSSGPFPSSPGSASPLLVDLGRRTAGVEVTWQLTLQVCVGLRNSSPPPSAYTLGTQEYNLDKIWLSELDGFVPPKVDKGLFLKGCFEWDADGYVVYEYDTQKVRQPRP